jgi:hypothetical protein
MSNNKKITHVVKGLDNGPFAGSGIGVYGKKDLQRRLKEAKQAGVRVRVYEVSEED